MTNAPTKRAAPRKRAAPTKRERREVWRALDDLVPDPANANTHTEAQIEFLRGSLRRFGQPKPVVIDGANVVRAGNGLLEAARRESLDGLWCRVWDGDASDLTAYAIADNRIGRMSSFDEEILREQISALPEDLSSVLGFTADEIEELLDVSAPPVDDDPSPGLGDMEYRIVIECRDEAHQHTLLERLEAEGLDCRAVMS